MLLRFAQNDGSIELAHAGQSSASEAVTPAFTAGRGLEISNQLVTLLHSTLDLEELLRLFARELARAIGQSGVRYSDAARNIEVSQGRAARHALSAALVVDNKELGSIAFSRSTPFTAQDERTIELYLSSLVLPLRNALLYHDAVQASVKDALTGVHNRKFLETTLRREVGLSHRHGTPLSLIVLDVDHFKSINDEHGHQAGDAVLRMVAGSLSECVRQTDVLARYGGDEFTILLSNTRLAGAVVAAHNIFERLTRTPCRIADTILRVSPSLGVAALRKRDGHERLFQRADAALYAAKRDGGGCIAVASGAGSRVLA
jgi:diguanylate cyclase (GGDEF)-like protein